MILRGLCAMVVGVGNEMSAAVAGIIDIKEKVNRPTKIEDG